MDLSPTPSKPAGVPLVLHFLRGLAVAMVLLPLLGWAVAWARSLPRATLDLLGGSARRGVASAPVPVDALAAAGRLAAALRFRTVRACPGCSLEADEDDPEFAASMLGMHAFLEAAFPRVHAAFTREAVGSGGYSLLFSYVPSDEISTANAAGQAQAAGAERDGGRGGGGGGGALFVSHLDVAAADEEEWVHGPFSGDIADGMVWGRGALDAKVSAMAILEGVEAVLAARESYGKGSLGSALYIALGHDEEVGGREGAAATAALLASRGVRVDLVMDEGGGVVDGRMGASGGTGDPARGEDSPEAHTALIGVTESEYSCIELLAAAGRWASQEAVAEQLCHAAAAVHEHQEAVGLSVNDPVQLRLEFSGAHVGARAPLRRVNALAHGVCDSLYEEANHGAMPGSAARFTCRLAPGDTEEDAVGRIRQLIEGHVRHCPDIVVGTCKKEGGSVSGASSLTTTSFQTLRRTIEDVLSQPHDHGLLPHGMHDTPISRVTTTQVFAETDGRHYRAAGVSDNVYQFLPLHLRGEETNRMHGVDERVPIDAYSLAVQFYAALVDALS